MSYNLQYQTNVVPKELFGLGSAGGSDVSMQVSPTGIILGGDLNTATPITATISQAGIITDNPTGFNILSSLNMNQQNITNLDTISSTIGDAMNISGDDNLILSAGGDLNLTGDANVYITASNNSISLVSSNDSIILDASNGISLITQNGGCNISSTDITISNSTGYTNSISLNTTSGDTTISSAFGSVYITSGNGDAGASSISLYAVEGDIGLNTGSGYQVSSNSPITSSVGYTGKVFHTDQPTTALTYYLTFVQSGGVSGYYDPAFDSATLTYNPSTNLLSVAGLQLSGATNVPTFSAGVLSCGCNESSSRQFQFGITANMTGLTLSNRRTNGVYTVSIYNVSGLTWTISNVLTGSAINKTNYNTAISIANGDFAILTARTLLTNGTAYNYVSVEKYS